MSATVFLLVLCCGDPPGSSDHCRNLAVDGRDRSYLVHIPPRYQPGTPTPVVLILHGAMTNAEITVSITGMNQKSDSAGFVAVYPNGTGRDPALFWNAWGIAGQVDEDRPDDVKFIGNVLDDLGGLITIDPKRVYATGFSNGGMMCYRLAAEMPDRIAAIAPVAGTMAIKDANPKRPVPVMHIHGSADKIVPWSGADKKVPDIVRFKSVEDTVGCWAKICGCLDQPTVTDCPDLVDDGTKVTRTHYSAGKDGSEVVLVTITGGGHTWPGQKPPFGFLGKTTFDISANELIWEFFVKHPMK